MADNIEQLNKELADIEVRIEGLKTLVEICKENNLALASWHNEIFETIAELKYKCWRIKAERNCVLWLRTS